MRKKRKGSSLIVVVIIFGMLIVFGTAMISMTTGEFKLRANENRRLENLYSSESGLDIASNIIVKTFDAAVKYGDKAAKDFKSAHAQDATEANINNTFQSAFKTFIGPVNPIDTSFTIRCKDELRRAIANMQYISKIQPDGAGGYAIEDTSVNLPSNKPTLTIDPDSGINLSADGKTYIIKIVSKFKNQSSTGENERTIQESFKLTIPSYGDVVYYQKNTAIGKYAVLQKAINVDGNMSVNIGVSAQANINGNILVKGNGQDNLTSKNKYNGGITIKQSKAVFNGEVSTSNTFNIDNNTNANINGNLYAGNVYAGNADDTSATINTSASDQSSLTITQQMVVDNDLAIKANNTVISMNDFYGINDKNVKTSTSTAKARTSSSIIVNGNQNSSVTVKQNAYIMGVAYIDTDNGNGDGYQTGESVGVKGNYLAYATPLVESSEFANCQFGKVGSLQLVQNLDALQKSRYFQEFSNKYIDRINHGGISLNKASTHSVGAIVYKDSNNKPVVQASNYSIDAVDQTITDKRLEYASKVYKMGQPSNDIEIYNELGRIRDTVASSTILNSTSLAGYTIASQAALSEKAIFNADASKTIVIKGSNSSGSYDNSYIVLDGNNLNAAIVTAGNVIIDGKVNFKGTILAVGDLKAVGTQPQNITYDKDLIDRIQATNLDLFKRVFGAPQGTEGGVTDSSSNQISIKYDIKKYLKSTLWTIVN